MKHHFYIAQYPNATTQDANGTVLGLKPAGQFMNETIAFVWPTIMIWMTSIVGWKVIGAFLESLKGK